MSLSSTIYGAFSGATVGTRRPLIYWEGTQSVAGNYTDITAYFIFWQSSSTYYSYNLNTSGSSSHLNTANINGDTHGGQVTTPYDTRNTTGNLTLRTHTTRVYHNADGTKTCWIGWSGDTNVARGTYNFGQTVTLDTIPRRATISTASANLTIGNNLAYTLVNNGSLYVRMEYWMYGNAGWYKVKDQNNGTGTTGTFTMSSTDNNNMYSRLPSTLSCSAIMRAYTYSDSGYSTQIGDYHDVTGTLSINQTTNKPTFTTYTVENVDKTVDNVDKYSNTLVSSSTATLLGSSAKLIKGYSKARAVITSANKMVALNYATAVKYRFVIGSSYKEENYSAGDTVNLDIDNISTGANSVTAYDSRGLTTTVSQTVSDVANYTPISLWGLQLVRDNGVDSATKLQVSGQYWNEYFGGGTDGVQNTITAHWRYKLTTESWDAQTWTAITLTDTDGALSFNDYIEGDLGASGFDTEKSFNIEVRIYDKLTNTIIEGILNVGTPVIDITSSGISIMAKYDVTAGGSLQVDGRKLLDWFYPVGTIYETTSTDLDTTTKMGNYFGGTWEAYGSGKVLVAKSTDTEFDTIGETGGAKTHTHTTASHSHTLSNSGQAKITGTGATILLDRVDVGFTYNRLENVTSGTSATSSAGSSAGLMGSTDSGTATAGGNNSTMSMPYIVVYRYRRTA